jgi:hypothetical protein
MSPSSKVIAIAVLICGACRNAEHDACEQAVARLARIDAAHASRRPNADHTSDVLDECRHGKYAAYDPVLRCALDADSDDAAAACIDAFVTTVLKPGTTRGSDSPGGLNPLLEPSPDRPAR